MCRPLARPEPPGEPAYEAREYRKHIFFVPERLAAPLGCSQLTPEQSTMTPDRLLSLAGLFLSFGLLASIVFITL
jgi:hypothetical protein